MKKVRRVLTRRLRKKVRVLMRKLLLRRPRRKLKMRRKEETAMSKMLRMFVKKSRLTSSWWTIRLLMNK